MTSTPQGIVFYVDRCLGRSIATQLKQAGLNIKYHDDEFSQNAQDIEWLSEVGKRGWIVLTKDVAITRNAAERLTVTLAEVRLFALTRQDLNSQAMNDILRIAIPNIQKFVRKYPAPFIAKVYQNGTVKMWRDRSTLRQEVSRILPNVES
jgi:predicted nuclease of predicted toxin-antitoxin system